jgi:predicted porin
VSIDGSYTDGLVPGGSNASISSNSSRLGFKGQHAMANDMTVLWQIETEISPVETGGVWASRDSFIGLKGGFGTVRAGQFDTPFKVVGGNWDLFGDTIADRRAILGASATNGNKLNNRGKNALEYKNAFGVVELRAMYSTDGADSNPDAVDNNDNDMTSVALMYNEGPLSLAVAYENWQNLDNAYGGVDATRVSAGYTFGAAKVGTIYESANGEAGLSDQFSRNVMGVNVAYKLMTDTTLKAQYLSAGDYDTVSNSGATMISVGAAKKLDKQTEVYLAYTTTKNDDNAKFQAVDGGHGDEVKTVLGGSPRSVSAGLVYKF